MILGQALFSFVVDKTNPCQLLDQSLEGEITSTQGATPTDVTVKILAGNTFEPVIHPVFQGAVVSIDMLRVKNALTHTLSFNANQCFQNNTQMCGNNIVLGLGIGTDRCA